MVDQLNPAFHADLIIEFFNEFGCYQTVSQRVRLLLHTASSDHLEAVGRHLPNHLLRVLPLQGRAA